NAVGELAAAGHAGRLRLGGRFSRGFRASGLSLKACRAGAAGLVASHAFQLARDIQHLLAETFEFGLLTLFDVGVAGRGGEEIGRLIVEIAVVPWRRGLAMLPIGGNRFALGVAFIRRRGRPATLRS
ncbi:MAG: hypothetical protein ABI561_19455, partial [Bradyrhizobium sp.]